MPPSSLIFADPAPRPVARLNEDARLYARRALDYGDHNRDRLAQAHDAYERLRANYATPPPQE